MRSAEIEILRRDIVEMCVKRPVVLSAISGVLNRDG